MRPTDPMEQIIFDALCAIGEPFTRQGENGQTLDFYLPDRDIHIEVKQFAPENDRIARQMRRAPNIILAQGRPAVEMLARLIRAGIL